MTQVLAGEYVRDLISGDIAKVVFDIHDTNRDILITLKWLGDKHYIYRFISEIAQLNESELKKAKELDDIYNLALC